MTGQATLVVIGSSYRPVSSSVDGTQLGQHVLVQDAGDQNTSSRPPVKHNMPAALHTTQARANVVTRPTHCRVIGEHLATCFQVVDITIGLSLAPGTQCIVGDAQQVSFGTAGKTDTSHCLTLSPRKGESLPDTCKYVALGNAAGIALIDGRTKRSKLNLVLLLLTLQGPQSGPHNLTGVFVAPTLNLLHHEAVKRVGQINIAGGHDDFSYSL